MSLQVYVIVFWRLINGREIKMVFEEGATVWVIIELMDFLVKESIFL